MRQLVTGLALAAAACASQTGTAVETQSGPTSFRGVQATFSLTDSWVATSGVPLEDALPAATLEIDITDVPGLCARVAERVALPDSATLSFSITQDRDAGFQTRQYEVAYGTTAPLLLASAFFSRLDGACNSTDHYGVGNSTIRLNHISVDQVIGSADVTLDDGSHLTGDFSATPCLTPAIGYTPCADGGTGCNDQPFECGAN